jgi:aminopeptidase-like protein
MEISYYNEITNRISSIGEEMYQLIHELYPICRSITGDGVRKTHEMIDKHVKLDRYEIPTGTQVFDWQVPKEWNIKDAYIIDPSGKKIVDFKNSNLHVLNYSTPINAKMSLAELKPHLFTLPEQPDAIPYLTSYYKENWGFCLSHNQFLKLQDGEYQVVIDSTLKDGHLTYGEFYLKGKQDSEILISCYTCHPSLCNDNLSGVVLTTFLAKTLSKLSLNYSYRFLYIPETIGAITWLSINEKNAHKIKSCLVVTCVGDAGNLTYKKSIHDDAEIDRIAINVLKTSGQDYKVIDFFPPGSDERQFSSPGFNIPAGLLMRTPFPDFPEYHTSLDNLEFMKSQKLADTFVKYIDIIYILENNRTYINLNPKCEPQLGKRNLYSQVGSQKDGYVDEFSILAVLNLSDGKHSLLDISERSGIKFILIKKAADLLLKHNLLKERN